MAEQLSQRLNLPVSASLLKALDDWRRQQEELPSRAEAARRLIELGLEASKSKPDETK